jgi:hypothetical protein
MLNEKQKMIGRGRSGKGYFKGTGFRVNRFFSSAKAMVCMSLKLAIIVVSL